MYDITHNIDDFKILRNIEHLDYNYILAQKDNTHFSISKYLRNHAPQERFYSIQIISDQDAQHLKKLDIITFINEIAKIHINPHHKSRWSPKWAY